MTILRLHIACWIPRATNTHSDGVIFIAFPLQQWLNQSASVLHCMYIAPAVNLTVPPTARPPWQFRASILHCVYL